MHGGKDPGALETKTGQCRKNFVICRKHRDVPRFCQQIHPLLCFEKLAAAYGFPYFRLRNNQELDAKLPEIFAVAGPAFVEVMLDPFEILGPKAASKRLPDGTMVVVDDAEQFVGKNQLVEIEFVRYLQTAAGKMMFAKLATNKTPKGRSRNNQKRHQRKNASSK